MDEDFGLDCINEVIISSEPKPENEISKTPRSYKIGSNTIRAPISWFGLSLPESFEFQVEAFKKAKIRTFMSNAFHLLYDNREKRERLAALIKEFQKLGLYQKCDSGGFQLMKMQMKGVALEHPLTPEIVMKKQKEIKCDIGVQLDVPLGPMANKAQHKACLDKTLENFESVLKINDLSFPIMPVIHGYTDEMLDYGLKRLEKILGHPPEILGIGSLVPMVKPVMGSRNTGGIMNFVRLLLYLRKKLPDTFIHAFGVGGTTAYLAIYCGVDSIDSSGWIQKTAYGTIQLPGMSDRFVNEREHNRPNLQKERYVKDNLSRTHKKAKVNEISIFMQCPCPACKPFNDNGKDWTEKDWENKKEEFRQYTEKSRLLRTIHNLWLFQDEMDMMANALQNGTLEDFVAKRLRFSSYFSAFKYAKELKLGNALSSKNLDKFLGKRAGPKIQFV